MPAKNMLRHLATLAKNQRSRISVPLLIVSLCSLQATLVMADTHSNLLTTPCDIRLVFGSDERGVPSVKYKLSLQICNQTARDIAGVSVYWLDSQFAIIGNSAAICGTKDTAVGSSESGPWRQLFRKLAALVTKARRATWTEIINHELIDFRKVKQCAIIGYDYEDSTPKTY